MRKSNKRITDIAVIVDLLNTVPVGRLGTIGPDGWPMIKPLNFAYLDGRLYFHCALEGEKLDHIRFQSRVCFEVDLPIAYVQGTHEHPCRAEYLYRSVIIRGQARLIEEAAEKVRALDALMAKYQPAETFGVYPEEKLAITGIVRIDIEEVVGKEELGSGELEEKALAALRTGVHLPLIIPAG
jgi:nitroimidazol reductase NimA-like FMN-containing flavoprotein (pyridoxamine 5'-phosphate oxidase superfamily)